MQNPPMCLLTSNNWGVIKEPWGHYGGEEHMFLNSLNTSSVRQVKIRVKEGRSWNKKKKKKVEHHLIDHHHRLLRFYTGIIRTVRYNLNLSWNSVGNSAWNQSISAWSACQEEAARISLLEYSQLGDILWPKQKIVHFFGKSIRTVSSQLLSYPT